MNGNMMIKTLKYLIMRREVDVYKHYSSYIIRLKQSIQENIEAKSMVQLIEMKTSDEK